MKQGFGGADYLLYVDRKATGAIDAKPVGPLTGMEAKSPKYAVGLLGDLPAHPHPLPFLFESNGATIRFTKGLDPSPRSREIFNFPRPATLAEAVTHRGQLRSRLRTLPPLDDLHLWSVQARAIRTLEQSFASNLLDKCRVHTILRLPTGIWYSPGVKANVIFFDKKEGRATPWTGRLCVYDLRTNLHFTLQHKPIQRSDFDGFVGVLQAPTHARAHGDLDRRKPRWSVARLRLRRPASARTAEPRCVLDQRQEPGRHGFSPGARRHRRGDRLRPRARASALHQDRRAFITRTLIVRPPRVLKQFLANYTNVPVSCLSTNRLSSSILS